MVLKRRKIGLISVDMDFNIFQAKGGGLVRKSYGFEANYSSVSASPLDPLAFGESYFSMTYEIVSFT